MRKIDIGFSCLKGVEYISLIYSLNISFHLQFFLGCGKQKH